MKKQTTATRNLSLL